MIYDDHIAIQKLLVLERQNLSSSLKFEPFLALDIAPGLRRRGWKYFCRFVSLFVLLSNTDFMNKPKFIDPSGILKVSSLPPKDWLGGQKSID